MECVNAINTESIGWYLVPALYNRLFFLSNFRLATKLKGRYRDFPYTPALIHV